MSEEEKGLRAGASWVLLVLTVVAAAAVIAGAVAVVIARGKMGAARKRGEKKKISLWHIQNYRPTKDVIENAVGRFSTRKPDVRVENVPIENARFKQKIKLALSAGDAPDVFHTWGGGVLESFVNAGKILELDRHVAGAALERYHPGAIEFCRVKGKLYALPLDVSVVCLWCNVDVFRECRVRFPSTFEELLTCCRELRKNDVVPIALGNSGKWPGAFFYDYFATRTGGVDEFLRAARRRPGGSFASKPFVEAGEKLIELVNAGAFPYNFASLSEGGARAMFFKGDAAMYLMGTWLLARAKEEAPGMLEKLKALPFPRLEGGRGDARTMLGGVNAAFCVCSGTKQENLAVGLLRELTSPAAMLEWAGTGRIPASSGAAVRTEAVEAYKLLRGAPRLQLYYDQFLRPELAELHKDLVELLFLKKISPEETARRMEERAAELAAEED